MRIRSKPWAKPELEACGFCINEPEALKGRWQEEFGNGKPIYLELGCGKGGFISKAASGNQQKNFIAVDIKNEMLVLAKRKIEAEYDKKDLPRDNIRIFIKNIEQIENIFNREDKVERIYINFCNPWPKSKHKKRRLTHYRQLVKYREFLSGELWFKTDDDGLFKESFEYFEQAGYKIKYKTYDLHESGFEDNIITEHEQMFTDEGKKIKFLIAEPQNNINKESDYMSNYVTELIVDGITAENPFKGIGIAAKGSSLRMLMDYKIKYPDSYEEITELLFKPYYGAGLSYVKTENREGSAFSSDAVKINPDIITDIIKEDISGMDGCSGSVVRLTGRIIKNCCQAETEPEYCGFEQIIKAEQPWSGYYEAAGGLWGAAHITHFISNSWKCVKSFNSGNSYESHAAFMSGSGDYTLVFTNDTNSEKLYNINVLNTPKADTVLYCVESVKKEGESNEFEWFRVIDKIIPARNKNGCFYRIDVKPHSILTCTTLSVKDVNGEDTVKKSSYMPEPLGLPYTDSFNYSDEFLITRSRIPMYTAGHCGEFSIRGFEEENVLEHISVDNAGEEAVLCIGDRYWSNYTAKSEVLFDNDDDSCFAGIGIRSVENTDCSCDIGCQFRYYPDGRWQIRCLEDIAAEGMDTAVNADEWTALKMSVRRDAVICSINRKVICDYKLSEPMIPVGCASLISSGHNNRFRNFSVSPLSGVPCFGIYKDCFSGDVRYGDGWSIRKNALYTEVNNTGFEFEFTGETVALIGQAEDIRIKAEIDDKIMTAGFSVKKSSDNQAFYYKSGLSEGNHTVRITVLSGRLSLSGIVTDKVQNSDKKSKAKLPAKRNESEVPKGKLKKSTLLVGAGLAAAGMGVFILNKIFKKNKK